MYVYPPMVTVFSNPAGEDPIGEVASLVTLGVVTIDAEGQYGFSFTCDVLGVDYIVVTPFLTPVAGVCTESIGVTSPCSLICTGFLLVQSILI